MTTSPPAPAEQRLPDAVTLARSGAALGIALGLAVLSGWLFGIEALKNVAPGLAAMQPITALCMVASGLALLLATLRHRLALHAAAALALLVLLAGLQTLAQYAMQADFGTDHWLFPEALRDQPVRYPTPGRMSGAAAVAFALLAVAILLLRARSRAAKLARVTLATVGLLLVTVALLGYLFDVRSLYGMAFYASMALHAAAGLAALFVAVLACSPDVGWPRLLTLESSMVVPVRALLVLVVLLPPLIEWLTLRGAWTGLYGPDFHDALGTLAVIALLATAVLVGHARIVRLERAGQRTRAALAQEQERATLALEATGTGTYVYDVARRRHEFSESALRLWGFSSADTLSPSRIIARLHPEDRWAADVMRASLDPRGNGVFSVEHRIVLPDGTVRWVAARGRTEFAGPERTPMRSRGVMLDVTERRRIEQALAETEARFRVMADSVPILIWVTDASGRMEFVNRESERFLGTSQEQLRGAGWRGFVHPDDEAQYLSSFADAQHERRAFAVSARMRRADGAWRWMDSTAVPRIASSGEHLGYVGSSMDVTERRAMEEEREGLLEAERAARSAAENANRVKDEFLATLSHELRTPLSVVVSWSRLLLRRHAGADEALKKGLQLIVDNALAQSDLITELLDMSRIVSGKMSLEPKPLDAAELLAHAVDAQRPAAAAKNIALTIDAPAEPLIVTGDATRLRQCLWNLLGNAIKFTPAGGHIEVAVRREDAQLAIAVRDSGEGIAPDVLPHVFDRFRQADSSSSRRHGGLGLGLAIVKEVVAMHGGSVMATSPGAGLGATFTVRLPLAAVTARTRHAAPEDDPGAGWLRGMRVLAVDDEPDMLEYLRRVLEEQGAEVLTAASGEAALSAVREAAAARPVQILVSDLGMPGLDGYQLIRTLRGDLGLGADLLSAVAVTAYTRAEDLRRAMDAGFEVCLTKPHQVGQLVGAIRGLAARRAGVGTRIAAPGA